LGKHNSHVALVVVFWKIYTAACVIKEEGEEALERYIYPVSAVPPASPGMRATLCSFF
jgi:hypothetical protein